jgi:UDP-sulfoquinovose synthase
MKILIAGINGYMGTALYFHLKEQGHDVVGFDNGTREKNVENIGSKSIVEKAEVPHEYLDACNYANLRDYIEVTKPDTIIWLAEQPSAPYSMKSRNKASTTLSNNMQGALNVLYAIKEVNPDIHLIKLGTEGEFPDWLWNGKKIPEGNRMKVMLDDPNVGEWEMSMRTIDWEIPTPRYFGSWYHFTKFSESFMMDYANRIWGLKITDVNQGIIYGHRNGTRLDADEYFGTVVHRFVAQAVAGLPLTVFGEGGQTRGMICLQNSLEALQLLSENPPKEGELRVVHQTGHEYSVKQVAEMIQKLTDCKIDYIENPRTELPRNKFTFDTSTLDKLGLKKIKLEDELPDLIKLVEENKDRINKQVLSPKNYTQWK